MARIPIAWTSLARAQRRERAARTRSRAAVASSPALDPAASAKAAGLRYVCDTRTPGIRRIGTPPRARYVGPENRPVRDAGELQRIRALAIPPAWTEVWICPFPNGHLQATGRDARGRKQYRYHPRWRDVRDDVKYGRLSAFAAALPRIRAATLRHLQLPGLPREKVLATVVQLLQKTLIRVGNEEYARENGSVGLTTMRDGHAKVKGEALRFEFRGKSGIAHAISLNDARLGRIVKACRDLPGYELFQYVDDDGRRQIVDSSDVNAYLRELSGHEFTAKDFRTWAGTVIAADALAAMPPAQSAAATKRQIVQAIDTVAKRLGNTKAVARKCYIHPAVLDAYTDGVRIAARRPDARAARARAAQTAALSREEAAVASLLGCRLGRKTA